MCGKNLRENINTGSRGSTIRNSSFTKVLNSVVEHLRKERSFVQRLTKGSGHMNARSVVQAESDSGRGFSQREVKAKNRYDLNLAFALSQSQMDSVYVADSQVDEGFVDNSGPPGGYVYPDSPVMGDEWEGYEKPSRFWTTDEDSESNLYEPIRILPVFSNHLRINRLAPLNFPEDYYGDTSGCESGDLSPMEPSETRDLLKQATFLKSPLGTTSCQNAYGAQPFSPPLESCPAQPKVASHTVTDFSPCTYGMEHQTTASSPSQGEGQRTPNRIIGSLNRLSLPNWAKRFLRKDTQSGIDMDSNRVGSSEDQRTSLLNIHNSSENLDGTISFSHRKSYLPRFPRFLSASECIELESFDEHHIDYEHIAGNSF